MTASRAALATTDLTGGPGVDALFGGSGTDNCAADPGDILTTCNP